MGVECGGASGFNFVPGQQFGKLGAWLARTFRQFGKGGGKTAPADIFYENRPFLRRGRSLPVFNLPESADDIEVLIELLLGRAFAKAVGVGDTIAIKILRLTTG